MHQGGVYHTTVFLEKAVDLLLGDLDGTYIDLTFGAGGHSKEILERLGKKGRLIAFDQDQDALQNKIVDSRLVLINQNFSALKDVLIDMKIHSVTGVLADLGVSGHQFDEQTRGFSIRGDGPLDMRMDQNNNNSLTAAEIIQTYTQEKLVQLFSEYGEVTNSKKLAWTIVEQRKQKKIDTTLVFKKAIASCIPVLGEKKYLAQVFQALRIEVNQEMQVLEKSLVLLPKILQKGGKAVYISYHSLEDRMVKNFFKTGNILGKVSKDIFGASTSVFTEISKKPILPTAQEVEENPRARSARMRVAIK